MGAGEEAEAADEGLLLLGVKSPLDEGVAEAFCRCSFSRSSRDLLKTPDLATEGCCCCSVEAVEPAEFRLSLLTISPLRSEKNLTVLDAANSRLTPLQAGGWDLSFLERDLSSLSAALSRESAPAISS